MDIKFEGLDEVLESIEKIGDKSNIISGMDEACKAVTRSAKEKAPKDSGDLRRSITYKVDSVGDIVGTVYTPLEYAPYREYGTGAFAEENPRSGYWVYVKGKSGGGGYKGKRYSLEDARKIVAMMHADGLEAIYTQGMHPHPFMRPALEENRDKVKKIIKGALLE